MTLKDKNFAHDIAESFVRTTKIELDNAVSLVMKYTDLSEEEIHKIFEATFHNILLKR